MLRARQILAILAIILIFSGWSGLVWAMGKSCTKDGGECATANEQCCCCYGDGTCDKGQTGEVPGGGVCFPISIPGSTNALECKDVICPFSSHTSIEGFIKSAVDYIFYISVILAPLMIIIGAFLFLTSAGSPKQSKLGGSIIQWTVIGFAIILFAKGITAIIKMILVG